MTSIAFINQETSRLSFLRTVTIFSHLIAVVSGVFHRSFKVFVFKEKPSELPDYSVRKEAFEGSPFEFVTRYLKYKMIYTWQYGQALENQLKNIQ